MKEVQQTPIAASNTPLDRPDVPPDSTSRSRNANARFAEPGKNVYLLDAVVVSVGFAN